MRAIIGMFVLGALAIGTLGKAEALSYPERTVRILVPSSPGGAIDISARIVANALSEKWKVPVIVENVPGASMRIGAERAAKATPDGYTLFVAHDGTMAMNPVAYPDLPYNPQLDFKPVALLSTSPYFALISTKANLNTVGELVELAKRNPGKLNHGGGGTSTLLALELLKAMAHVQITNIPYRGAAKVVAALLNQEVDFAIVDVSSAQPLLKSDRVKVAAITSAQRSAEHPEIPTVDESGVKGYEDETWMGMFAPAKTPPDVLAKIRADVHEVMQQTAVRDRFQKAAMTPQGGDFNAMRDVLNRDIKKWRSLVSEQHIKIVD